MAAAVMQVDDRASTPTPSIARCVATLDGSVPDVLAALLEYEQPLRALPLLCLYKHLATDRCRSARHSAQRVASVG